MDTAFLAGSAGASVEKRKRVHKDPEDAYLLDAKRERSARSVSPASLRQRVPDSAYPLASCSVGLQTAASHSDVPAARTASKGTAAAGAQFAADLPGAAARPAATVEVCPLPASRPLPASTTDGKVAGSARGAAAASAGGPPAGAMASAVAAAPATLASLPLVREPLCASPPSEAGAAHVEGACAAGEGVVGLGSGVAAPSASRPVSACVAPNACASPAMPAAAAATQAAAAAAGVVAGRAGKPDPELALPAPAASLPAAAFYRRWRMSEARSCRVRNRDGGGGTSACHAVWEQNIRSTQAGLLCQGADILHDLPYYTQSHPPMY